MLTKLHALDFEYIYERTQNFVNCGVIDLQISMSKYISFCYVSCVVSGSEVMFADSTLLLPMGCMRTCNCYFLTYIF